MISILQIPEPDWDQLPAHAPVPIELKFDLDDHMVKEIQDTWAFVENTVSIDNHVIRTNLFNFKKFNRKTVLSFRRHNSTVMVRIS